jgi:hypothetical protein
MPTSLVRDMPIFSASFSELTRKSCALHSLRFRPRARWPGRTDLPLVVRAPSHGSMRASGPTRLPSERRRSMDALVRSERRTRSCFATTARMERTASLKIPHESRDCERARGMLWHSRNFFAIGNLRVCGFVLFTRASPAQAEGYPPRGLASITLGRPQGETLGTQTRLRARFLPIFLFPVRFQLG